MIWVTWRQFRLELVLAVALLIALAAFLVPTGLAIFDRFETSGLEACLNSDPSGCRSLGEEFMINSYGRFALVLDSLTTLPAILGILLASPVLLELEQRTYRLAWTQSVTRRRWLAVKLGFALLGALALSGAVALLMGWWLGPLARVSDASGRSPWGQVFTLRGVNPAAYVVFCLALALAAGALWRRMLPAIIVALAGFLVLSLWVGETLRPIYLEPHRFWQAQAIEAAIFLAAATPLIGLTMWVVTTRSRWRLA